MLGMTPSKYKDGAANLRIRFAIAQSFLGLVLGQRRSEVSARLTLVKRRRS